MSRWCALLLVLGGCHLVFDLAAPTDGTVDAPDPGDVRDAPDGPDPALCFGEGVLRVCLGMAPPNDVLPQVIDTGDPQVCAPAAWPNAPQPPDACVLARVTIEIEGLLRATGPRPLVLLAADTLVLTGALDVSSRAGNASPGAGAATSSCPPGGSPSSAGGGAGGSFLGAGGRGGNGNNVSNSGGAPAPPFPAPPPLLRGGCTGGAGSTGAGLGGSGGLGGGAVYLVAGARNQITGIVNASGAGGAGAGMASGGGGGGSGGMIVLAAPAVIAQGARIIANGGGGGSGAGATGMPGGDPDPNAPLDPAPGGTITLGGDGGAGFAGTNDARPGAHAAAGRGGGGGGGGAGYVWSSRALAGAQVSPEVGPAPGP